MASPFLENLPMNEAHIKNLIAQIRHKNGAITLGLKSGKEIPIPADPSDKHSEVLLTSNALVVRIGEKTGFESYYYIGYSDIEYIKGDRLINV
ncbi:hypothetical protein AAC691_15410 [Nguyenibacter vanlangensis]|uniref:Uncharacterized protein n=1 Tax=Nguyenibacter vanlangensis TaxID=1216886 RepID=A0ABZ3D1N2_9PROT